MLEFRTDDTGKTLPIKNKSISEVCTPGELIFFFKHCFALKERKFKMILLAQLGCECRVGEAVAINLNDFHKGTNYRELDMLMQKKKKHNVIEHKILPESIAAHLRAWIKDKWVWINACDGYIFPDYKTNAHVSSNVIQRWFCNKRKQLIKLFPDKSFGKIIGHRRYNKCFMGEYKEVIEPLYLWKDNMGVFL